MKYSTNNTDTLTGITVFGLIAAWVLVCFTVMVGWVMNIVDLMGISDLATTEGILRLFGIIVVPLGAVMGLFL